MLMLEIAAGIALGVALIPLATLGVHFMGLGFVCIWRMVTHPVTIALVFMLIVMWLLSPHPNAIPPDLSIPPLR